MFKLILLSAICAIAAARPGGLYSSGLGYGWGHGWGSGLYGGHAVGLAPLHVSSPIVHAALPAVSHQSSTVLHGSHYPVIKSYAPAWPSSWSHGWSSWPSASYAGWHPW